MAPYAFQGDRQAFIADWDRDELAPAPPRIEVFPRALGLGKSGKLGSFWDRMHWAYATRSVLSRLGVCVPDLSSCVCGDLAQRVLSSTFDRSLQRVRSHVSAIPSVAEFLIRMERYTSLVML
jgi:hypothetical protein